MGFVNKITASFWIKVGKPEKVYPVKVNKYKRRGNDWIKQTDRGRTVEKDKGKVFELMNEDHVETKIPYSAFNKRGDNLDEVDVLMPERDTVVPAETEISPEEEKISKAVETTAWETWAEQEFEDSAEIVKTDEEPWYMDKRVHALMIFFGAGLFFMFLGIGYSYVINEAVIQEIENLRTTIDAVDQEP